MEALNKRIKDRISGSGEDDPKDELSQLAAKLDSLDLPEETKRITDMEIKKLK